MVLNNCPDGNTTLVLGFVIFSAGYIITPVGGDKWVYYDS